MNLCKQCGGEIKQPEGKRKKGFCNNTCRSNFWYNKNRKVEVKNLNNQTTGLKETEKKAAQNESINTERVADLEKELASLPENNSRITNMRRVFLIKEINKVKVLKNIN